MKLLWCWRCQMEVPMLDDDEFAVAKKLYSQAFGKTGLPLKERYNPLLDYYNELTGFGETVPHAIIHHQISKYGEPCEECGKPYRTPKAAFCAACGNRKS